MYEIDKIYSYLGDKWQCVGYSCTSNGGVMAWGIYISGVFNDGRSIAGMLHKEWIHTFNRNESLIWQQILELPLETDAKRQLGETGVYPENLLDVVGKPNSFVWTKVGAPKPLKIPCPF